MSAAGSRLAGQALRRHPARRSRVVALVASASGFRRPSAPRPACRWARCSASCCNPLFLVLFCSMFLTAASELAPGPVGGLRAQPHGAHAGHPAARLRQRADVRDAALRGPARAQAVADRPAVGLVPDGIARPGRARASRTRRSRGCWRRRVWGTGVCYMWPTMLATASERFPRGGALLMGLMGTAGTLSIRFVLPIMGIDLRREEDRGGRRRGRVQRAPAGRRARARARHRGADVVPRRRRSCRRSCWSSSARSGCTIAGAADSGLRRTIVRLTASVPRSSA